MKKNEFWFITTEHLEDKLLFRDSADFVVAMNYVATLVHKLGVSMVSFVLMSNHMHFVIWCDWNLAGKFINSFKMIYSRYLTRKYGFHEHLRNVGVDIRAINLDDEGLETVIAYVQTNPVAANICAFPSDYPWGSGSCFFCPKEKAGGIRLSELSARERYRIMHSKCDLPSNWVLKAEGYIDPMCYVQKDLVERTFRTPKRMNFFLRNSSKAKKRIECQDNGAPAFRDQLVYAAIPELCWSLFQKKSIDDLDERQTIELFKQVRFRFASNVDQIARVSGRPYEVVAAYLDSV